MSRTSVEDRIALLLAKAESTTPEEAEALTEHAERLMLRHGIEQAAVAAARAGQEQRAEPIVEVKVPFSGVYGRALVTLGSAVAREYGTVGTYYLQVRGQTSSTLVLVGHASDVRAVETLVTSLVLQGRVALDRWWKTLRADPRTVLLSGSERTGLRRDYLMGFGQGAAHRLRSTREAVHAEAERAAPGSTLAVVDRSRAVDAYLADLGLRRGRRVRVGGGYDVGRRDGRRADVGTTPVAGLRRAVGACGTRLTDYSAWRDSRPMVSPQMLKGVLPIVVLWSLADADAYGYAILKRLRDAGFDGVGDASVYGTLQRHHDAGFVTSYLADGGQGPARRWYTLTPAGRLALDNARRDWHALVRAVDAVVPAAEGQHA